VKKSLLWTVVFAIATLSAGQAKAVDQLWTGSVSDNVNTAGNWVGGNPDLFSFYPIVFGSNVVGGTMALQPWVTTGGLSVTSGETTPITINGAFFLFGNGGPISLAAGGSDLTVNPQWLQGWGDINFDVGAGRTLTMNGSLGENGGWAGNAGLVKNGAGTAVLNAAPFTTVQTASTAGYYTGPTSINAGTLKVTYDGGNNGGVGTLPVGSSITVSSGANLLATQNALGYGSSHAGDTLTVNKGGSLTSAAGSVVSMPYALNVVGGTIASVDGGNVSLGSFYYASTSGTFTSASDGTAATISAQNFNLQGASFNVTDGAGAVDLSVTGNLIGGALVKNGAGVMALSGSNSYTGDTTVNGGTLQVAGAGSLGDLVYGYGGAITIGTGANLKMSSSVGQSLAGVISGGGSLTMDGNSLLILSGSGNSYTGGTRIDGGAVMGLRGSLGTGPVVINNGGLLYVNDQWVFSGSNGFNVSYPNPSSVTVNAGGSLAFDYGNGYANGITNLYLNGGSVTTGSTQQPYGALYLYNGNEQITASGSAFSTIAANIAVTGNNNSITVDGGSTLSMSGILKDNGAWGAGGFIKSGAGTFYLSGNNTYSGASTVSEGILKFANVAATGSTSGITVNNVGSVWFDPGTAGETVTTPISLSGDGGGNAALNTYTSGGQVTFSGPVTLTSDSLVRALGDNGVISFTNAISGSGALIFAGFSGGGGTKNFMILSGSSDFTGALSVTPWYAKTQVTLSGGDNRLPTTALVAVHGVAGQPGALDLNGNNQMIGGLTDSQGWGGLDAGARTVVNTSGTPVTLTLNVASTQSSGVSIGGADINGTVGNNLALVKMGNGSQTLSGAGSYTGGSTIQAGTLILGNATALGATTGSLAVNGGTLDLAGFSPTFGTFSGSAGGVVTSASSATFTVSSSANSTYAGSITGGVAVTKGGSGQFTLSGSNTYTGATTVSAGSLMVDGSLLNSAVTISPGATLKGHGTIGGSVSVLGTLSPGNSPGVISLGSVTLGGSSSTIIEINGTGRGTDYDGVNVTSSSGLTYGGLLSFNFGSLSPDFVTYHIFDFTGGFSGAFATVSSAGAYAGTWTDIGGGQFQLLSGPQTLTFTQSTGDVVVVPEPAAVAFVGVGTLLAGLVVRRRRKSA